MTIFDQPPPYRTYLLTLWQERSPTSDQPGVWRFNLVDPRTNQRRGFASLEALFGALQQEMANAAGSESAHTATSSDRGPP
ncbi:MAG: hypothetical protein BroJett011_29400 [Chloroflexota bacterium]|nr:MAG: hypothetical protein BroJett011_29400 [Chloroflexota bacterium]